MSDILEEARALVEGARHESYGPARDSFTATGRIVGALFRLGRDLTPEEVATFMIVHKLVRESYSHHRDNLVDIAGYAKLIDEMTMMPLGPPDWTQNIGVPGQQ